MTGVEVHQGHDGDGDGAGVGAAVAVADRVGEGVLPGERRMFGCVGAGAGAVAGGGCRWPAGCRPRRSGVSVPSRPLWPTSWKLTGASSGVDTAVSAATGASLTGFTVMFTVAATTPPLPSLPVKVNESGPLKLSRRRVGEVGRRAGQAAGPGRLVGAECG